MSSSAINQQKKISLSDQEHNFTQPLMSTKKHMDASVIDCACGHCGFEDETNANHRSQKRQHKALVNKTKQVLLLKLGPDVSGLLSKYLEIDWSRCTCGCRNEYAAFAGTGVTGPIGATGMQGSTGPTGSTGSYFNSYRTYYG